MACSELSSIDIRLILSGLPVELLYEVLLISLSESFPYVNKHLHGVFVVAPVSLRAEYLLRRLWRDRSTAGLDPISALLRYPICTKEVMEAMFRSPEAFRDMIGSRNKLRPCLPRRLFKSLTPKPKRTSEKDGINGAVWSQNDDPLPFLRFLYDCDHIRAPDPNTHDGYALTKAVHASFLPLVQFLLYHGASPQHKESLAVKVAIRQKDVNMVRMLVERDGFEEEARKRGAAKRRKKEDRIVVSKELLRDAVKADAREIVTYFMREKGAAPDLRTLKLMDGCDS